MIEHIVIKTIPNETHTEKRIKRTLKIINELWDIKQRNIYIFCSLRNGEQKKFKAIIMSGKISNLMKTINLQIKEVQQTPSTRNVEKV